MMAERLPSSDPGPATARKGSWLRTAKAVAWSFFGIRRHYLEGAVGLSSLSP